MGKEKDFDKNGFPNKEGVYLVKRIWGDKPEEIDVYSHPIKGLCCWVDDYGGEGSGVDDETNGHASVGFTGLEFISRVRDLN